VTGAPTDFLTHTLQVTMVGLRGGNWVPVAGAPPFPFVHGRKVDPQGFGGFQLTTEFNLVLSALGELGTFYG